MQEGGGEVVIVMKGIGTMSMRILPDPKCWHEPVLPTDIDS